MSERRGDLCLDAFARGRLVVGSLVAQACLRGLLLPRGCRGHRRRGGGGQACLGLRIHARELCLSLGGSGAQRRLDARLHVCRHLSERLARRTRLSRRRRACLIDLLTKFAQLRLEHRHRRAARRCRRRPRGRECAASRGRLNVRHVRHIRRHHAGRPPLAARCRPGGCDRLCRHPAEGEEATVDGASGVLGERSGRFDLDHRALEFGCMLGT